MLRWFARTGLIERDDVREMLACENSGFSLDASVRPDLLGLNVRYGEPDDLQLVGRYVPELAGSGLSRRGQLRPAGGATGLASIRG
mgnify:CR=1 FL=1